MSNNMCCYLDIKFPLPGHDILVISHSPTTRSHTVHDALSLSAVEAESPLGNTACETETFTAAESLWTAEREVSGVIFPLMDGTEIFRN